MKDNIQWHYGKCRTQCFWDLTHSEGKLRTSIFRQVHRRGRRRIKLVEKTPAHCLTCKDSCYHYCSSGGSSSILMLQVSCGIYIHFIMWGYCWLMGMMWGWVGKWQLCMHVLCCDCVPCNEVCSMFCVGPPWKQDCSSLGADKLHQ